MKSFLLCLLLGLLAGVQSLGTRDVCNNIVNYHVQAIQQACCKNQADCMDAMNEKLEALEMKYEMKYAQCATDLTSCQSKLDSYTVVSKDCEENKTRKLDGSCPVIDPDGSGGLPPFQVKCDMSLTPARIIIEHNYTSKTEVRDAPEAPNGKTYNIEYEGVSKEQLVLLTQTKKCSQFLRYDCHGSMISLKGNMQAYWKGRDGNKMNYWPGGKNFGCACGVTKTCAGGTSHFCNCEKNDKVWRFDEGTITDDSRLPISSLFFSDTDDAGEEGYFTLGPLICY